MRAWGHAKVHVVVHDERIPLRELAQLYMRYESKAHHGRALQLVLKPNGIGLQSERMSVLMASSPSGSQVPLLAR